MGQVVPGRIFCVTGASAPDGRRKRTVTDSDVVPGLNTSISVEAPGTSWAWGMAQCGWAAIAPGTSDTPPDVPPAPTISCTTEATTRPVRVVTTVLMLETSWTSVVTFSTATCPAGNTIPW